MTLSASSGLNKIPATGSGKTVIFEVALQEILSAKKPVFIVLAHFNEIS